MNLYQISIKTTNGDFGTYLSHSISMYIVCEDIGRAEEIALWEGKKQYKNTPFVFELHWLASGQYGDTKELPLILIVDK